MPGIIRRSLREPRKATIGRRVRARLASQAEAASDLPAPARLASTPELRLSVL